MSQIVEISSQALEHPGRWCTLVNSWKQNQAAKDFDPLRPDLLQAVNPSSETGRIHLMLPDDPVLA